MPVFSLLLSVLSTKFLILASDVVAEALGLADGVGRSLGTSFGATSGRSDWEASSVFEIRGLWGMSSALLSLVIK